MRRLLWLALVIVVTPVAGAQIIRRGGMPFQEPTTFVSFGVGLLQPWDVTDGTTNSVWNFSDATQFAVAIERNFGAGASVGVRGTTARVPLRYSSLVGGDASYVTDADANVSPRFSVDVVLDQITTLHQKSGLSAGASSSARLTTTRIVARFGLGARVR
jgi:hypothetical protein